MELSTRPRRLRSRASAYDAARVDNGPAVVLISAYLILATWIFGAVEHWSRAVLFYAAAAIFVVLFLQRPADRTPGYLAERVRRLLGFPVFWLGLLLFAFVGLQMINPDFRYVSGENSRGQYIWWLTNEGMSPREGWPTTIEAPAARGNPLTFIYRYAAGWLMVLALWLGLRSRRDWEWVLLIFTGNMVFYAVVTLLLEISGTEKVLWLREWAGGDFSGVFFYRNHGGAFLYLGLAVVWGLFLSSLTGPALRALRGAAPRVFLFLCGILVAVAAVSSVSRGAWGGTAALYVFLLCCLLLAIIFNRQARAHWDGFVLLLVPVALILLGLWVLDQERLRERFDQLMSDAQSPMDRNARYRGNLLSLEMWQARPLFGYGADTYLHAVGFHQERLRELQLSRPANRRNPEDGTFVNWVAAHNDTLQYLAELGWVGASPIFATMLFWAGWLLWHLRGLRFCDAFILFGLAALLVHSVIELIFLSGTLVVVFAILLAGTARVMRLTCLERATKRRAAP